MDKSITEYNQELTEVTPRSLPEYEDDNKGHRYMTLWNVDSRENASFEHLLSTGGLLKGRVDFYWDFKDKTKIPYQYYLEVQDMGERRAYLFTDMISKDGHQGLLNYINMGKPVKVNTVGNHHFTDFDASTKDGPHQDDVWTNTGIVEIGCYFAPNNGWDWVKIKPQGETSLHITIDMDDFRDIEIIAVTKNKHIGNLRFRRDFPLLSPVDYTQSVSMGGNYLNVKLHNDQDLVVDLVASGGDTITHLYWKHVN